MTSAIMEAIVQNTPGYSRAYAQGVPRSYNWCAGTTKRSLPNSPPATFTALTAWGQVYPRFGNSVQRASASVEIANARTFVRRKGIGEWTLVQTQPSSSVHGAHFRADFAGNSSVTADRLVLPNGNTRFGAPQIGYNTHFWLDPRGTYEPGAVDGVYVQMEMRAPESTTAAFVANIGVDWWASPTAEFRAGFSNNPSPGMSNWVVLSGDWTTLFFYSLPSVEIVQNPPPPLRHSNITLPFEAPPAPDSSPCRPSPRPDLAAAAGLPASAPHGAKRDPESDAPRPLR